MAPRSFLKEYWEDTFNEKPVPLYFHKRTVRFAKEPPSRLQIKRIAGHRIEADGNMSFLAHKEGEDVLSAEYLPARDFLE